MDHNLMLAVALANVPTIITVLIGMLLNNGRFSDINGRFATLDGRMSAMDARMASMENRMTGLESKFDTRSDLLLSKVVDIDNRLTRLEPHQR